MGIVRLPHYVVQANNVPQLDTRQLIPEIHKYLSVAQIAGAGKDSLRPQVESFPFVIATF